MAYSELLWRPFLWLQAWSWTTPWRGNVFYYVYKRFSYFCHVFTLFNFKFLFERFLHLWQNTSDVLFPNLVWLGSIYVVCVQAVRWYDLREPGAASQVALGVTEGSWHRPRRVRPLYSARTAAYRTTVRTNCIFCMLCTQAWRARRDSTFAPLPGYMPL